MLSEKLFIIEVLGILCRIEYWRQELAWCSSNFLSFTSVEKCKRTKCRGTSGFVGLKILPLILCGMNPHLMIDYDIALLNVRENRYPWCLGHTNQYIDLTDIYISQKNHQQRSHDGPEVSLSLVFGSYQSMPLSTVHNRALNLRLFWIQLLN